MTTLREAGLAAMIVGGVTLGVLGLRVYLAPTNLAMVYLLGVTAIAMRCSRRTAVASSFASVAAFDFFGVPHCYNFGIADSEYLVTFAVTLAVALVISTQTARLRGLAEEARGREARTEALYRLSHSLSGETRMFDAARSAAATRKRAGTADFRHARATYLPLNGTRETYGVMAVIGRGSQLEGERQLLLEVFATQIGVAIERMRMQRAAEESHLRMQTEQMRSSLLSAVSHDLRTPLATITGAASTLRDQDDRLDVTTRRDLLESISDEAERLSRLVTNLLDMTRFESGDVDLRRDLYPLEEIVGATLQRLEPSLHGRTVTTDLPADLPLIPADDVLLGQVLWNLLDNAVKHTPEGSPIEIAARVEGSGVILEIRDRGPGILPGEEGRIFEKFYRGPGHTAQGAGLGLPICRAIVAAHGGTIQASNRVGGGAVFCIQLPAEVSS